MLRTLAATSVLGVMATALLPAQWASVPVATPPGPRYDAAFAFDVPQNRMLLFGGDVTNETWSLANGVFTRLLPTSSPPPRMYVTMAHDPIGGSALLYGGHDGTQFGLDDTWAWTGSDWQPIPTVTSPGGLYRHAMAYDAVRQRYVVYGGCHNSWTPYLASAGTFEYANGNWTPVVPVVSPPALIEPAMAFLHQAGITVLFGGLDGTNVGRDETWTYDGTTWTQTATTGPRPRARYGARMVTNLTRGVVVLVGGREWVHHGILTDTWEFDGATWREVTGAHGSLLPPRDAFAMAHDLVRDRIVVFGGALLNGTQLGDTLEFGAHFRTFGLACAGSVGSPQLVSVGLPRLGQACTVDLTGLPPTAPIAALAIGLSRTQSVGGSLPLALTPFGLTGCQAYTSAELIEPLTASNGTASWSFVFPASPSQLGDTYHLQGLSFDPNWNPAWLVTSNAATLIVGH